MSVPIKLNPLGLNKTDTFNIPLTFTAIENNSSVQLIGVQSEDNTIDFSKMYYRTNISSPWTKYENQKIDLNQGNYVQFWNKKEQLSVSLNDYAQFVMSGKIEASGNCQSLLNFSHQAYNFCFTRLFQSCSSLITAPELPALIVGNYSYFYMFNACTLLISAPELPALSIGNVCYANMFISCFSLKHAPSILPATTLKTQCYQGMFYSCNSLIIAPKLPASSVTYACYYEMFNKCFSLETAPELPATTLADSCYCGMFGYCSSLITAPELPASSLAPKCYWGMFSWCTSLTTAPELPATNLQTYCYYYMFNHCTSLSATPNLPASSLANNCYQEMFSWCTSLINTPILSANILSDYCCYAMFLNCTSLISASLPATILANHCYQFMFSGCTSLSSIFELPATTLFECCYANMFSNCISLIKVPELPASALVKNCYLNMFTVCNHLTEININFIDWNKSNNSTTTWVNGIITTSGTFIKPAILSEEYGINNIPTNWSIINKLEYIKSTGTQYIDTGVIPDYANGDKVEISFYLAHPENSLVPVFGSRAAYNNAAALNGFYLLIDARNLDSFYCYKYVEANENEYNVGTMNNSLRYWNDKIKVTVGNNMVQDSTDNYTISANMLKQITSQYSVYLFALNQNGSLESSSLTSIYTGMRLYYWKYWHNGILTQHLIPALDNNLTPCLYDLISKNYYYNNGTDDFEYSLNMPNQQLQYLESTGTQYINTGVTPDFANGDSIQIKFFGVYMGENVAKSIFGSRNVNNEKVVNGLYITGTNIVFCDSEGYTLVPFNYMNEHILTINDNEVIDNGSLFAQTPKHITCDYPIYLFTLNNKNLQTIGNYQGLKIYEWKYYHNGELAQHLIPALDNNLIPCMYDLVSGNYYYNEGTRDFNYPAYIPKKQLHYLESTGTQYINTDIIPDFANGDKIVIHFYGADYTGASPCIVGTRESGILNGFYSLGYDTILADSEGHDTIRMKLYGEEHILSIDDSTIILDGTSNENPRHVTCKLPVFLFALNNYGTAAYGIYSGMKLYDWKYYHKGILVQHLIPALDQNNVPCLFDIVSNTYKYNAGTGTFNYA